MDADEDKGGNSLTAFFRKYWYVVVPVLVGSLLLLVAGIVYLRCPSQASAAAPVPQYQSVPPPVAGQGPQVTMPQSYNASTGMPQQTAPMSYSPTPAPMVSPVQVPQPTAMPAQSQISMPTPQSMVSPVQAQSSFMMSPPQGMAPVPMSASPMTQTSMPSARPAFVNWQPSLPVNLMYSTGA